MKASIFGPCKLGNIGTKELSSICLFYIAKLPIPRPF